MHATYALDVPAAATINFDTFLKVDIRIGTIVSAKRFPEARKPAYTLVLDFGPVIGRERSSVHITENYCPENLPRRQVAAVVDFPPRQIGTMRSKVLMVVFANEAGAVTLFEPDKPVPNGSRLF